MILDKDRPYGDILGKTPNGARYVQDGVEFNAEGEPVDPSTNPGDQTSPDKTEDKPSVMKLLFGGS